MVPAGGIASQGPAAARFGIVGMSPYTDYF